MHILANGVTHMIPDGRYAAQCVVISLHIQTRTGILIKLQANHVSDSTERVS